MRLAPSIAVYLETSPDKPETIDFFRIVKALARRWGDVTASAAHPHDAPSYSASRGNSTIEVFWRCWNRCMRMLPDDHYHRLPAFTSRIVYAYNTAPHESLNGVSPYEI